MAATGTINVRINETLKQHGNQVLDKCGLSITQAVQSLYEYLEREQSVPDWMAAGYDSKFDKRRVLIRKLPHSDVFYSDADTDLRDAYREHLLDKYA